MYMHPLHLGLASDQHLHIIIPVHKHVMYIMYSTIHIVVLLQIE